jgi:hypothetical protein
LKLLRTLSIASIFYAFFRFLLWLIFYKNRSLAETINYHYSESLLWYFIWFVFPIISSFLISIKLKIDTFKKVGFILFPALLVMTIIGGYLNKDYWGYYFKRPSVFKEIKEANEIINIKDFMRVPDSESLEVSITSKSSDDVYSWNDFYYTTIDRPMMTFIENRNVNNENLSDWYQISKDSSKLFNQQKLKTISTLINNSNILVKPNKGYEHSNGIYGRIINFKTLDGKVFYHLSVKSLPTANDHSPNYEILISDEENLKIEKSNIFFTDMTGFEGLEYANIAGLLEFLLLIISSLITAITLASKLLLKQKIQS